MDNTLDLLKEVIAKVDVITINDEEARQLTGEYSLVVAARKIQEMGPEHVVIKKGEHGALLFHKEQIFLLLHYLWKRYLIPQEQVIHLPADLLGFYQNLMI